MPSTAASRPNGVRDCELASQWHLKRWGFSLNFRRKALSSREVTEVNQPLFGAERHDALIFPSFVMEEIQGVAELRPPEGNLLDCIPTPEWYYLHVGCRLSGLVL